MTEKILADCTPAQPWTPVHDTLLTEPGVLRCKQTLVKPGNSELVSMTGGAFPVVSRVPHYSPRMFHLVGVGFLRLLRGNSNRPRSYYVARASLAVASWGLIAASVPRLKGCSPHQPILLFYFVGQK